MPVFHRIVLCAGPLGLLVGLILLAQNPYSHSAAGVLQLFLFSLFVSLGFLLFGGERFDAEPAQAPVAA